MEYQKENITARENLEEAIVAAFMDQYAQALDAGIDRKIEECAGDAFPEELDKRCRALIEQANRKAKNKKRIKSALRVLRSAAVVTVVLVGLFSVLFVSVEAFRLPVMNYFLEKTDRYWHVSSQPIVWVPERINPENPLENIIPDDFMLVHVDGEWESGNFNAEYFNGRKSKVTLMVFPSGGMGQIDTEGAYITQCEIGGYPAVMATEDYAVRLMWTDESTSSVYTILTMYIAEDVVINIAEEFAARLEIS